MKAAAATLALLLLATPLPARADDAACFKAAVEGQKLERSGKLLDARERFVACAQRACEDAAVVDKCTGWLKEVEAALPSLTIAVKDDGGHDRVADRARLDDTDASAALSGRAIEVDPGLHKVTVDVLGTTLTESVVMLQGEKLRAVVFHAPGAPRATGPARSRGLLAGAVVAASVAAVGTGLVAYFGATGLSARSEFGCATGCAADHFQAVHQDFVAADAALGIAIGSAVVMTVLLVVRQSSGPRRDALLRPPATLGFTSSNGLAIAPWSLRF